MANNRRRKQSQADSPHPPHQSPAMSSQRTPRMQTRSQQVSRQQPQHLSPQQQSVTMSPHAGIHGMNPVYAPASAADEFPNGGRWDGQHTASFAEQYIRNQLPPQQPQSFSPVGNFSLPQSWPSPLGPSPAESFSPSQNFSVPQSFLPALKNPTVYAHIGGAPVAYGYQTGASVRGADIAARVARAERVRMLQENDFRVPTAEIYNGPKSPGQKSQYSIRAASPVSPMIAPQPLRSVSQQLLQGYVSPVIPQTPVHVAQAVPRAIHVAQAPPPQFATRLPPLDLARRRIPDSKMARSYTDHPRWRPLPKSHGVPQTEEDRLPYVKKIYDAIVDISDIYDDAVFPTDAGRFEAGYGVWGTAPACIEAVAHEVVEVCMNIHNKGATGFALARFPALRQLHDADKKFTFHQRIHFMALLLRHFKFHANHVMQSHLTMQYAARIWSTLWELPGFSNRWKGLSAELRTLQLHDLPYRDVPAKVLTPEEGQRYVREAMQEQAEQMKRAAAFQQQRQEEMMRQQAHQVSSTNAMKRAIEQVHGRTTDLANKRQHVEMPSGQPVQQQPDAAVQEQSAPGEDAFAIKNDNEQTDFQPLFRDGTTSRQGDAQLVANLDEFFDAGDSEDDGDGMPAEQKQDLDEGADGETMAETEENQ